MFITFHVPFDFTLGASSAASHKSDWRFSQIATRTRTLPMSRLAELYLVIENFLVDLVVRLSRFIWRRLINLKDISKIIILLSPLVIGIVIGHGLIYLGSDNAFMLGFAIIFVLAPILLWVVIDIVHNIFVETPSVRVSRSESVEFVWIASGMISIGLIAGVSTFPVSQRHTYGIKIIRRIGSSLFRIQTQDDTTQDQITGAWRELSLSSTACSSSSGMTIWLEGMQNTNAETVMLLAAHNWSRADTFLDKAGGDDSYILDEFGVKYDFRADHGDFMFLFGYRTLKPGEVYRWSISYSPINLQARSFRLRHGECPKELLITLDTKDRK